MARWRDELCRDRRRWARRVDGGGGVGRGRHGGRARVRRDAVGRPQVPARRQGRTQPHPPRAAAGVRAALRRAHGGGGAVARCVRPRRHARMGRRIGHRHLRRHVGPRLSYGSESRAAVARLAAPLARARRALSHAAPLARLCGRRRRAALCGAARRGQRAAACDGARARRRELAAAWQRRRLGAVAARGRRRGGAAACRPTAASRWRGASICARGLRARRSSQWCCASTMRSTGKANSCSARTASKAASSMRPVR